MESLEGVRTLFERNLPDWVRRAAESPDAEAFRRKVMEALPDGPPGGNVEAALRRMAGCEGQTVRELSRDEDVRLETLSLLWKFLAGREGGGEVSVDFALDAYNLLLGLRTGPSGRPDRHDMASWMRRWPDGMNAAVMEVRKANKRRIMELLVQKITAGAAFTEEGDNRTIRVKRRL